MESTVHTAYKYGKLGNNAQHIRVLTLQPSKRREAPLRGSLTVKSLHAICTRYEALSYTWGTDQSPEDLILNGHAFAIGFNLRDALRRLRHRHCTRCMWIDAVCINQDDVKEKTTQISIMRLIYANAWRTIIWLGEESREGEAKVAMQFFSAANEKLKHKATIEACTDALKTIRDLKYDLTKCLPSAMNPKHPKLSGLSAMMHITQAGHRYPLEAEELDGILRELGQDDIEGMIVPFLQQSWFGRRWVIQEVILSRWAVLLCGRWTLNWKTFESAINVMAITPWFKNAAQDVYPLTSTSLGFHRGSEKRFSDGMRLDDYPTNGRSIETCARDLLFELDVLGRFQCQDPRDIISAILGLWKPLCGVALINYAFTTEQNYTRFALHMIDIGLSAKILYAAVQRPSLHPSQIRSLPSWVPDWRTPTLVSQSFPQLMGQSIGTAEPSWAESRLIAKSARDGTSLYLRAIILDTISGWFHPVTRWYDGWITSIVTTQLGGSGEILNLCGTSVATSHQDITHSQWKFSEHLVQPGDIVCAVTSSDPFTQGLRPYPWKLGPDGLAEQVKDLTKGLFVLRATYKVGEDGSQLECYSLISIMTRFRPANSEAIRQAFLDKDYQDLVLI